MLQNRLADNQNLSFHRYATLAEVPQAELEKAVDLYRQTFAEEPYQEDYTHAEAVSAFEYILERDGELLIGSFEGQVVALAGGYPKGSTVYFIEELAVIPEYQGRGFGRLTLQTLLDGDLAKNASRLEIRTTVGNSKAIRLYESEGFVTVPPTEVVAHRRRNQQFSVDERTYLSRMQGSTDSNNRLRRVAVVFPSGNTTAIVFDQRLGEDRALLNSSIMQSIKTSFPELPEVEQCCFVTVPTAPGSVARVEMFGGEFCGNATRSVIWLIAGGRDCTDGFIEVSGVKRPLKFNVTAEVVSLEMPLPDSNLTELVEDGLLVRLEGITHIVVTDRPEIDPRMLLERLLSSNRYALREESAVGVSCYSKETLEARFCVWVREVDTIFDETACGSGTSAIGVALATADSASVNADVIQPSGETITALTTYDPRRGVTESWISGNVKTLYDGELKLL